jgi:hypothetical protein
MKMSVSEALKTTFKGEGPTTQVIIPRAVAEEEVGAPIESDEAFAQWIDENNDQIYASAAAKRETATLYETVVLAPGDMRTKVLDDGQSSQTISTDANEEARVVLSGEPVEGNDPLFVGPIHDAVDYVLARPVDQQKEMEIWTPGRVYSPDEIMQIGRERGRISRHGRGGLPADPT